MAEQARAAGRPRLLRARRAALPLLIAALGVLLWSGAFSAPAIPRARHLVAWSLLLAAGLVAAVRAVRFKLRSGRGRDLPGPWAVEGVLLLLLGAQALVQLTGGAESPLQPLRFLLAAGLALALPLQLAAPLLGALAGLDALALGAEGALPSRWPLWLAHTGFTALFAALYHVLLATRLLQARRAEAGAVRRRVAEVEERARELRLVATSDPLEGAVALAAHERELLAAVVELEEALRGALGIAEAALRPHTVALFLCAPDSESLRLRECISPSERLFRGPLPLREGALGAVLAAGRPIRLDGDGPALAYYQGQAPVGCFLGVPLLERSALAWDAETPPAPPPPAGEPGPGARDSGLDTSRLLEMPSLPAPRVSPRGRYGGGPIGVLIADRDRPFSSDEERVLTALAAEVVRAIEAERLLSAVRREKEEKARFFRALEALNRTSTAADAAQVALEHARRLCPTLDLCALTLREGGDGDPGSLPSPPKARSANARGAVAHKKVRGPQRARHRVVAVWGEGTGSLEGLTFADNPGLVANVVRLGAALPGREAGAMDRLVIFDGATAVRGLSALKIFPLRAGDQVIGTLVCGSRRSGGLPPAARSELAMLALQAAEALLRARLFEQAERLATTDGLTGLSNRRSLDAQLRERFAEAARYQRCLSFVLIDVDHFKKVNDGHGHPAGDTVLRGVAAIVAAQARETDRAARYGGEEMALLLPETGPAGARVIAERLRAAIEQSSHETESGSLRVTVSLGVATFPSAGLETPEQLLEAADQALYRAKQGGRNRVESAPAQAGRAIGAG